ncbi:MAG: hypothetical protein PHU58_08525 [Prevotella sp.]|nr:hypothetical protein [Prevotella sp.]
MKFEIMKQNMTMSLQKQRTIFTTPIRHHRRDIPRVCPQRRTVRQMHPHDTINRYAHIHGVNQRLGGHTRGMSLQD